MGSVESRDRQREIKIERESERERMREGENERERKSLFSLPLMPSYILYRTLKKLPYCSCPIDAPQLFSL